MTGGNVGASDGAARVDEWQLRLHESWRARGLVVLAATVLAVVNGLAVTRGYADERVVERTSAALTLIAAALFFGAGVIHVSRWRVNGDSRSALMGVAFIVFGSLSFPMPRVSALLHATEPTLTLSPLTGLMITVVTAGLVVAAVHAPTPQPSLRLGRLTLLTMSVPILGICVLGLIRQWLDTDLDPGPFLHTALQLLTGILWVYLAAATALMGRRTGEAWALRVAPLLAGMAVVSVFKAAAVHDLAPWGLSAAALVSTIGALVLTGAMLDLSETTTHERRNLQDANGALARAELALSADADRRQEMAHDAHNALAAMTMTMTTLFRYGDRLDETTADRLRAAALAEISLLEHLINRSAAEPAVDFDVDAVVRPVAEAQRLEGLDVRLPAVGCRAHGCPADFATVVQNLLVNARRHGRGGRVSIRVSDLGDEIQVCVEDRGPGIPEHLRAKAFERGVRGEHSGGSGLGLYVARSLMLEQNGAIELVDRPGGGTVVVLTLPAAKMRAEDWRTTSGLEPVAS